MALVLDGTNGVSGVDGTASNPAIEGTDSNTGIFYPAADTWAVATGGAERVRVDSAGNAGLGVTPSAWGSTFKAFQIGTTGSVYSSGTAALANNFYVDSGGTNRYLTSSFSTVYLQNSSGQHAWFNAASGTAGNAITFTQAMTLTSDGELQIAGGSTNTTYSSPGQIAIKRSNNAPYMSWHANDGTRIGYLQIQSGGVAALSVEVNQALFFATNATERARITSGGDWLVGKTADNDTSVGLRYNVAGGNYLSLVRDGNPPLYLNRLTSDGRIVEFARSSSIVGRIEVTTTATSYLSGSSDYRLKENISPLVDGLARVNAMKPVSFTWKEIGKNDIGFIAHELQQVIPESISGEKDAVDEDGNPEYQSIFPAPAQMIATLVAAIQELNAKVEAQAAEIAALKGNA